MRIKYLSSLWIEFFLDSNNICRIIIKNCSLFDENGNCTTCQILYKLVPSINRCIPIFSIIQNCVSYNHSVNQLCDLCDENFYLLKLLIFL